MEANKIRLLEFMGSGKRTFNIPVYQRNYDWKREHCVRLFKDIEKIALSGFELEHFLGTVVYVISYTQPTFTEYVLIDGQQRITSITLLLNALYEAIQDTDLRDDIYESYIINKRAPEPLRIKLKPIESDMTAYEEILQNRNLNGDSNIHKNCDLFKSLIDSSVVSPEDIYHALNNIELVYIQLEKEKKSENPQVIFESLNSTGQSLTPADLIRNFLLMNHSYDEQTKLYREYWLQIEKLLTNNKISDFVRDYLTLKTSKIPQKSKVYETFKCFANDPKNNLDEQGLLEDLLVFSHYYSAFLYFNSKNSKINDCLKQFQYMKSTTVYPLLLYLFDDCYAYKKINEDQLVDAMKILICYIYRRLVCNYPTNASNTIFASLPSELDSIDNLEYIEKILTVLSRKTSSGRFPRNQEFETGFIQKDMYKSKLDKYTLRMIEYYLSKERVEIHGEITVEHIMPQTLTPQWQIELGRRYSEIHSQYLHTIGNLTISGYNQQLSNKSFAEKKEIYKTSNISLCRNISNYDIWNDTSIRERAKSLAELAKKIWYLPEKFDSEREESNTIDYATPHSIIENLNITGEKPKQLIIGEDEFTVSSWKNFLRVLCAELYSLDSAMLYNLVRHSDFSGRARFIINNSAEGMISPHKIADSLFIETNLSALDILNYCKILCTHYEITDDVYFTLNRSK